MTGFELATIIINTVQAGASLGAVIAIFVGIRQMRLTGDQRAAREDTRHAEAMARLDQQAEALRGVIAGLERQGEALERQGRALEATLTGRA